MRLIVFFLLQFKPLHMVICTEIICSSKRIMPGQLILNALDRGTSCGDFVELEEDIITRLIALPESDLPMFYRLAVTLTKPMSLTEPIMIPKCFEKDEEIKKALEVIHGLRSIAHEVTRCEDMHEYYWGLLLDAFFSLKLTEPYSPKWRQGLLLSSLLCARLKNWGRIWPLAGWLSLDNDQVNRLDDKLYMPVKENGRASPWRCRQHDKYLCWR